jgi:glycosyltransferase involved in cell wall biosynthesis
MVGKGIRELIQAASMLASLHPALKVMLGGDGDSEPFAEMARKLGIEDRIHFLGWVGPAEKDRLLKSATLLALPSYNEGLPMCVLEAMAARLPVVSTAVGGIPDVVTDGQDGLLVPARDAVSLAAAIQRILSDRPEAAAMAERAAIKVQTTYDARLVTSRVRDFYAERCRPLARRP